MAQDKFMQTFDSETEVLRKIEELKAQGSSESDMYVMAQDKDQISMVRGRTDVDYKSAEGNWMDKFMGMLSGNDATREAFSDMGVDDAEADRYYQEIQNGKILLFVDQSFEDNYNSRMNTGGVVGAADTTGDLGRRGHMDTNAVGQDGLTVDTNDTNETYYNSTHDTVEGEGGTGSRFDRRETAGVGEDSGTGFGLGAARSVDDVPPESTNDRDFMATNRDLDTAATTDNEERFADRNTGFGGTDTSLTGTDTDLTGGGAGLTGNDDYNARLTGDERPDYNAGLTGNEAEEERLRLHEEKLRVDKERVQTGEVNVGKHVVEEEQSVDVPVEREEVYIERRPVDEETTGTHDFRDDNENIHVPISEEHVDVSKKDVVSEELVVGKRKVEDTETVRETVRREEADIDETDRDRTGFDNDGLGRNDRNR